MGIVLDDRVQGGCRWLEDDRIFCYFYSDKGQMSIIVIVFVLGIFQYMVLEIIDQGLRGYGKAVDIWLLGCIVIEMVIGRLFFYELGSLQVVMFQVRFFRVWFMRWGGDRFGFEYF